MKPPLLFLSDHATKVDLLYFEAISQTIVDLILSHGQEPLSLGVHGDWGAGKSSVLEMIYAGLVADPKTLCIRFNGWQFQGLEDAKFSLIESIITEVAEAKKMEGGVLAAAGRLGGRVDVIKFFKTLFTAGVAIKTGIPNPQAVKDALALLKGFQEARAENLNAPETIEKLGKAIQLLKEEPKRVLPEEIRAFHDEFAELIDAAKIDRLVILIDDMDRCLPKTTIETLEAIRLFLFAKKTTFVIAADEAMIEYCVRQHFPELPVASGPLTYAKNYLEKLIQVPFRIPALSYLEAEAYIALTIAESTLTSEAPAFRAFLASARETIAKPWLMGGLTEQMAMDACEQASGSVELEKLESAIQLSHQISQALNEGTRGNPRQIKRFLNALFLRERVATARGLGKDIVRQILAKLMLAEFYAPTFYGQLRDATAKDPNGKPSELRELEAEVKQTKKKSQSQPAKEKEWADDAWIVMWAKISPDLGDVDLRPYHFITSDRRIHFAGNTAFAHLGVLLEALTSGGKLVLQGKVEEIEKLSLEEAQQLFNAMIEKLHRAETYSSAPEGLFLLVNHHASLQSAMLNFITSIPTKKLGVWAMGAGMRKRFLNKEVLSLYEEFVIKSQEQTENLPLAAAAKSFGSKTTSVRKK
jgi:predicted KAP-like P-loop ATPase